MPCLSLQGSDVTWVGLLGLKQDHAAVQMLYVSGSSDVARGALRVHPDGFTSPIRIGQRMRLEQTQLEGVARKIQVCTGARIGYDRVEASEIFSIPG